MSEENGIDAAAAQVADPAVDPQSNSQNQSDGIQKRIDELTARFHEEAGKRQQAESLVAELIAKSAHQQPVQQAAPDEADLALQRLESQYGGETAAVMRAAIEATTAKFTKQLAETQAMFANQQAVASIDSELQQRGIQNADVSKRAKELIAGWKQRGLQLLPGDAITFALGEAALKPQPSRQSDGRFAPTSPVLSYAGAPPAQVRRNAQPTNFESLSAEQQLQWFDQSGIGDKPF